MFQTDIESNSKYNAALVRADAAGYIVTAIATCKSTGLVTSCIVTNNANKSHTLTVEGNTLVCECKAAANSTYCMHRACATRHMIIKAAAKAAITQEAEQEADRIDSEATTGHDVFDATTPQTWHAFDSVDALFDSLDDDIDPRREALEVEMKAEPIIMRNAPPMSPYMVTTTQPKRVLRPRDQEEW